VTVFQHPIDWQLTETLSHRQNGSDTFVEWLS
jgi:hypothetical protein